MSLIYKPLNGIAGTITASLTDRISAVGISSATLNIADFEENDEQSAFSSVFENVNDELIFDYYGFRKVISFSIYNKYEDDTSENAVLPNILSLISMINQINASPDRFRLSIQYRSNSIINDAVFIGDFKLEEATKKANAGQIINLTFKSRNCNDLDYSIPEYNDFLMLESGGHILLESGDKLLAETYTII